MFARDAQYSVCEIFPLRAASGRNFPSNSKLALIIIFGISDLYSARVRYKLAVR